MTDRSTFSAAGVDRIHATGRAVIDLAAGWPTRDTVLGGEAGPVWDVDAPLDRPITVDVVGPLGALRVEATTIRLLVGGDELVSVVGLTRSFDDGQRAADELRRTAEVLGLAPEPTTALVDRVVDGPVERRRRHGLHGGQALGIRGGVTLHRLPARGPGPRPRGPRVVLHASG
ncbi:hypothetical protein [Janibacter hoylei]|nr:hypothetical protein [Janibacter hoylei]